MSSTIHPREVADKSSKENLALAIGMALEVESDALRLNTQTFNTNRYKAVGQLPDYEALKDRARAIKEQSTEQLPELIEMLTRVIESRGGKIFFAATAQEATEYVKTVCASHNARRVVKAKSITSEEIGLNRVLEEAGVEVAETDLAEFILQISKEQPSHIVAPAIHRSRERISELFKTTFQTDRPLDTGEDLTAFARDILRQKFLDAEVGISGANLIAAEEGTILLVESEGNIRLTTHLPAVHIAIAGIEKIIRSKRDFGTFIELLAASGTGQPLSTYTNILEPPLDLPVLNLNGRQDTRREFHLVLVDNGRMAMRADVEMKEALYCIRCSACMNVCTVFQAVGGHAFGGECYTGGIGGAWTIGTSGNLKSGQFAELCTGCSRCVTNCPVRIDIPRLNSVIKQRLIDAPGGGSLQKTLFGNFSLLAKAASVAPGLANWASNLPFSRRLLEDAVGFDTRRKMPHFPLKTLTRQYRRHRSEGILLGPSRSPAHPLMLLADVYTTYSNPHVGMAIIRVFEKLGLPVGLTRVMEDGRAAQSQGLLRQAARSARHMTAYLSELIRQGNDIVVAEPSVLALFRQDYKKLVGEDESFAALSQHTFDPMEYINLCLTQGILDLASVLQLIGDQRPKVFYHGHCQMKSIGLGSATPDLLRKLGFDVDESTVECCGMAGSFGYKKAYYDISVNIGRDLTGQIERGIQNGTGTVVLASGTSCREQIGSELDLTPLHPAELLARLMGITA